MTATASPPAAARASATTWTIRIVLGAIGLLTASPVLSLVNPSQLESYGVFDPGIVELSLLQHRGVLQLALGAALVWAAFDVRVRVRILLAATVTKGAGVLLTLTRPEVFAAAPGNIGLWFDLICLVVLPAIAILTLVDQRQGRSR